MYRIGDPELNSLTEEELDLGEDDEMLYDRTTAAQKPHYIVLKVLSGPLRRELYIIESELITIGRGVCTLSINDLSLSPIHCTIEYREGGYWLSDANSESGTYLQLEVGLAFPVQVGDVFRIGNTEINILGKTKTQSTPTDKPGVTTQTTEDDRCCVIS